MLVAHISDLHLGAKSPGDPHGAERLNSLRQCLSTLAGFRPDALVVAGDLFDSPQTDRGVVEEAAKSFADAKLGTEPVPVVLIPGNHDPADADKLWTAFQQYLGPSTTVRVMLAPEMIELAAGNLLVECYPCQTRYSPEPPWVKRLPLPANRGTALRVVVAHDTLQGAQVPQVESDAYPFAQADVEGLSADYVALGHYHGLYPPWPDCDECERTICYCGTHEPDQFASDAGYAVLATLAKGERTRLRRVKVGRRHWRLLPINGPSDLAELDKLREEIGAGSEPSRYVIRLKVGGARWTTDQIGQLEDLEGSLRALGAHIERRGDVRAQLDIDGLDWTGLPSGAVKQALVDLHAEWRATGDEKKRQILSAALRLGWEKIQEAIQS